MKQKLRPYVHTRKDNTQEAWQYYFVDDNTGIIYFERRINNKRFKFSTGEKNGDRARRYANNELERRLGKKLTHVRKLIGDHVRNWLNIKETEGLDLSTLYGVRRAAKEINRYWGDKLPTEITRDSLAAWYIWWPAHNDHQMENVIKWFKNLCRYMHETMENGMPALPAIPKVRDPNRDKIKMKRQKAKERIISSDEFKIIFQTAPKPEDALKALIMYTMATRIEETCQLDFARTILLDEPIPVYRWYFGQNKADHFGQHALHLALIEPLKDLRAKRLAEGTTLLFPQERNNLKPIKAQMVDWAGWRDSANLGWHWTAHTFRHTCLTNLFNDPKNPQAALCKQYRVSIEVALETYVKTTQATMLALRDAIEVKL